MSRMPMTQKKQSQIVRKVEAIRSLSFKTVTGYIVFDDCVMATKLGLKK